MQGLLDQASFDWLDSHSPLSDDGITRKEADLEADAFLFWLQDRQDFAAQA